MDLRQNGNGGSNGRENPLMSQVSSEGDACLPGDWVVEGAWQSLSILRAFQGVPIGENPDWTELSDEQRADITKIVRSYADLPKGKTWNIKLHTRSLTRRTGIEVGHLELTILVLNAVAIAACVDAAREVTKLADAPSGGQVPPSVEE